VRIVHSSIHEPNGEGVVEQLLVLQINPRAGQTS
jgi:hypothetical protein